MVGGTHNDSDSYFNKDRAFLPDTGERMALAVTYLLALAVFFLMVEVKLPVSPDLPLIAKYYCCTIIEAACGLVAMCSVLRFVHSNPEPLPEWVQVIEDMHLKNVL